ncbi:MAG TPA: DUF4398 domain-containing protein, partial [Casimicrobiaceae bacterium]|nr:DUF4398 domain-containing protein [Casimicrobiaceae bacterium]
MKRSTLTLLACATAGALAACATVPPPTEQMAVSQAAIGDAQNAQAPALAPVTYHDAQANLEAARAAMASGKNLQARRFAEEAEADARLAATQARAVKAEQA